jgi:MoaA/NifB/PqqE/SkfB family radical SAM enzyme
LIAHILAADFARICIVGKEPLANGRSIETVRRIVERASRNGKTTSLVTNGLNGHMLPTSVLERLAWIDVSLDGGPTTYEAYRGGSWEKLRRSVTSMRARGLRDLRVLQTLSVQTVDSVADMLEAGFGLGASLVVFSPFQPTRAQGKQAAVAISPTKIVKALEPFADDDRIYVSFDAGYACRFEDAERATSLATDLFGDRFTYVDSDPVDRGIVRVTYDGLVLTPFEAVNTDDYRSVGRLVLARPLAEWFGEMLRSSQ